MERLNIRKLKDEEIQERYKRAVDSKMLLFPKDHKCIDDLYGEYKDALVKSAEEVRGRVKSRECVKLNNWWNDDARRAVREKNEARERFQKI